MSPAEHGALVDAALALIRSLPPEDHQDTPKAEGKEFNLACQAALTMLEGMAAEQARHDLAFVAFLRRSSSRRPR